jgi:hypothetical protein
MRFLQMANNDWLHNGLVIIKMKTKFNKQMCLQDISLCATPLPQTDIYLFCGIGVRTLYTHSIILHYKCYKGPGPWMEVGASCGLACYGEGSTI